MKTCIAPLAANLEIKQNLKSTLPGLDLLKWRIFDLREKILLIASILLYPPAEDAPTPSRHDATKNNIAVSSAVFSTFVPFGCLFGPDDHGPPRVRVS